MSFTDSAPPTESKRAYVHPVRRDGKHAVTFVYPISGRSIRKLIPAAELEARTAGYVVIRRSA